jgi:hypothetical protein
MRFGTALDQTPHAAELISQSTPLHGVDSAPTCGRMSLATGPKMNPRMSGCPQDWQPPAACRTGRKLTGCRSELDAGLGGKHQHGTAGAV